MRFLQKYKLQFKTLTASNLYATKHLTPELVNNYQSWLTDPQAHGLPFEALHECFDVADKITAQCRALMGLSKRRLSPETPHTLKNRISFPSTEVYPPFLTLTLPGKQYHCDKVIKELFGRFMEYLTGSAERGNSGWNVKNYIWVSETQKNGNLHFHVILDRGLPAARIQQEWNRIIERLGYVTRFGN